MSRPASQKLPKGSRNAPPSAEDRITDPRFSNIQTDARFRLPSKRNTHVQIDKRFSHMLRDERFSSKAKVDRYGRKLPKDKTKELHRFYKVKDGGGAEEEAEDEEGLENGAAIDDKAVRKELKRVEGKGYDPARDGGFSESSSSEESSSDEEDEAAAEDVEDMEFADQQGDGIPAGEVTSRIAVVNLDWDNIRATDLMAVFTSFVPTNGRILKVTIYPSEFGKERMEREQVEGPPKEIFASQKIIAVSDEANGSRKSEEEDMEGSDAPGDEENAEDAEDDEEDDEKIKRSLQQEDDGAEFDPSHLRRYQLERLRYFYAVLTCSSNEVAEALYNAIDGTEYLATANFFDLRFIPDEMDFSNDKPRDECERIPDRYKPNDFVTDALQHSKVRLTWDEDDMVRKEVQRRAFRGSRADIDANDLKVYLGSDSSGDDEVPEAAVVDSVLGIHNRAEDPSTRPTAPKISKKEVERQRMRKLLGFGDEASLGKSRAATSGPLGDMQITFSSGLSDPKSSSIFANKPEDVAETTAEKYIRKEKERKMRRKEKSKAAREGQDSKVEVATDDAGENGAEPVQDLGFEDPFFTAPEHDRAETDAARKEAKRRKREERAAADASSATQRAELELLMIDEDRPGGTVQHSDMNAIARATKVLKRKTGKKDSKKIEAARQLLEGDNFRMDVADPRFTAVYERAEFAVNPAHPKFKATEGMKSLLEEGRKRKRADWEEEEAEEERESKRDGGKGVDLEALVARVKGRAGKAW